MSVDAEETYTCPHCGFESYNLNDVDKRYCRACLHFCDDVDEALRLSGFVGALSADEHWDQVKASLAKLDGTRRGRVALLSGLTSERLDELGGVGEEDVQDRQDRSVLQGCRAKRRLPAFLRRWLSL